MQRPYLISLALIGHYGGEWYTEKVLPYYSSSKILHCLELWRESRLYGSRLLNFDETRSRIEDISVDGSMKCQRLMTAERPK